MKSEKGGMPAPLLVIVILVFGTILFNGTLVNKSIVDPTEDYSDRKI